MDLYDKINVGSAPNSKDGDPLREAFIKVNRNFESLFESKEGSIVDVDVNFEASPMTTYLVNTQARSVTCNFPENPKVGDILRFVDAGGKFSRFAFRINPMGTRIKGNIIPVLEYTTDYTFIDFFYTGHITGWIIR